MPCGLGYTTFISEINQIRTQVRVFVPRGEAVVIQHVTVTNLGKQVQPLDLIPVVEYTHPDALKQLNNADWVPQTMGLTWMRNPRAEGAQPGAVHVQRHSGAIISQAMCRCRPLKLTACFLGQHGYGTWASPAEFAK
jgi:cellobiose phosphorylase